MGIVVSGQDRFGQGFVGAFNAFSSARDRKERLEFEEKQQVEIKRRTAVEERRQIARDKLLDPLLKQQYELGITKSKQLEQQIQLMDAQTRQLELKGSLAEKEMTQMMAGEATYTTHQIQLLQTQKEIATAIEREKRSKDPDEARLAQLENLYLIGLVNTKQITAEQRLELISSDEPEKDGNWFTKGMGAIFNNPAVGNFFDQDRLQGFGGDLAKSNVPFFGGSQRDIPTAQAASIAAKTPAKKGKKKSPHEQIQDHYIDIVKNWWDYDQGDEIPKQAHDQAMQEARIRYMKQVSGGR